MCLKEIGSFVQGTKSGLCFVCMFKFIWCNSILMDMLHVFRDVMLCNDDYYMQNANIVGLCGMSSKLRF